MHFRLESKKEIINASLNTYSDMELKELDDIDLSGAEPSVRKTLEALIEVKNSFHDNGALLLKHIDKIEAVLNKWKTEDIKGFLTDKDDTNFNEVLEAEYMGLKMAHEKIIKSLFLFEELYNAKQTGKGKSIGIKQLDNLYIKLQDYIYNKLIVNKKDVAIKGSILHIKELLHACLSSIDVCKNSMAKVHASYKILDNREKRMDGVDKRYELLQKICEKGDFSVESPVRYHLTANDSTGFRFSPMMEVPSVNYGFRTGFIWSVIPVRSRYREMLLYLQGLVVDNKTGELIHYQKLHRFHTYVVRTSLWERTKYKVHRRSMHKE